MGMEKQWSPHNWATDFLNGGYQWGGGQLKIKGHIKVGCLLGGKDIGLPTPG